MLYNKMGQSVIQLMRYDAAKASSSSGSDDHQASTSRPFSVCGLRSSLRCRHDRMQSVRVLGASSMRTPNARAADRFLD